MTYVFLVIGSEYEGAAALAAFEAKRDAEALAKACAAYDAGPRPASPEETDDTPENAAAWEKFGKRYERWQNKHPGGKYANSYDRFTVQRIRLQPPSGKAPADSNEGSTASNSNGTAG